MKIDYKIKNLSGWGNYYDYSAKVFYPNYVEEMMSNISNLNNIIARGYGRSYGDSACSTNVIETSNFNKIIFFDKENGILKTESGIKLFEIINLILKHNWFLPVTPGTSNITIGGAVASDVHGKNHHNSGTFSKHILSITLLLGSGEIIEASLEKNIDLFRATCGGMGLTGIILDVTFKLISIKSNFIDLKTIKTKSLRETCETFQIYSDANYSVAWINFFEKSTKSMRGIVSIGEHSQTYLVNKNIKIKKSFAIPNYISSFLNDFNINIFNKLYYHLNNLKNENKILLDKYFYPLDGVKNWNYLYGRKGFLQYQFVIPNESGIYNLELIVNKILNSKHRPYLAVLKKFGPSNGNLLSFPIEGFTLALDFKFSNDLPKLLYELDLLIIDLGGKINLCKDAIMKKSTFRRIYPEWSNFEEIREKYNAIGKFSSLQSRRLGLL